jgi:hypothetical protein
VAKESSAVANLLELMAQKPLDRYSDDDLLFAGPAKATVPAGKAKRARSARPQQPTAPPDTHLVTHRISRMSSYDLRKPLLAATIVVGGLAIGLALYKVARHGGGVATAAAAALPAAAPELPALPAPAALPEPAPVPPAAPIVQPIAPPPAVAPAPKPSFVDLSIDSKPAGATVTLIDRGATSVAGTTPLALAVDSSREVDLELALAGQEPKRVHVDPHTMKKVVVELAVVEPEPAPAAAPTPAPAHAAAAARSAPKRAPAGNGTLMVSTKPPCEIAVDGSATGLVSPQKAIRLAAGPHQITFTSTAQHIKKTVAVTITANHSTKLIRDLMKK